MNDLHEFLTFVQDEIGLAVTDTDAHRNLDEIPGWDSVHLLWILTALERRTGRAISLPDVLEAANLEQIYRTAVAA
jgi:acyl carrier protein